MRRSMWWSLQNRQSENQTFQCITLIFADSQYNKHGRQVYLQLHSAAIFVTTKVQQRLDTISSQAC